MKAVGLIVEYNPFHYGHQYHIEKARELTGADCVIAVMSGSFLQRGEPAFLSKLARAEAAVKTGADLVIELPYMYAAQSAYYFAKGAVLTLAALGADTICFGSESGEIADFYHALSLMDDEAGAYDALVQQYLGRGLGYPAARGKAFQELAQTDFDAAAPNNILGLSYLSVVKEYNLKMKVATIKRISSNYHDKEITGKIASATSIRHALFQGEKEKAYASLPKAMQEALTKYESVTGLFHSWDDYFPYLHYRLLTAKAEELAQLHGVDEGIEHRLIQAAKEANTFQSFMDKVRTKRYTDARIMRMLTHILAGTTKKEAARFLAKDEVPYVRTLAFNNRGQAYLNIIKKSLTKPLVSSYSKKHADLMASEERISRLYNIPLPAHAQKKYMKQEFQLPLIIKTE